MGSDRGNPPLSTGGAIVEDFEPRRRHRDASPRFQCHLTLAPGALSPWMRSRGQVVGDDSSSEEGKDMDFPSLKSAVVLGNKSTHIAIGLPQHSFPGKEELERRVKHLSLLPVIAIDPQTIQVKDTPLRFVWSAYGGSNCDGRSDDEFAQDRLRRDNQQILEAIKVSPDQRRRVVTGAGDDELCSEVAVAKQAGAVELGRPIFGAHIQDLFNHSYTPLSSSSPCPQLMQRQMGMGGGG